MAFTHLHVHSEYSLLDGMSKINKAPEYVKSLGMDSLAITDHGVMFGIIDFYKSCKKSGIKPIIGCEVYVAPRTRFDKDPDRDRNMNHLILLAENMIGYKNLTKLVSAAFTEGFYFKPRVDKELLREHSEGIICLSACLAGAIPRKILNGDYSGAKAEALELRDIFGKDNFYLEIQNHFLDDDKPATLGLVKLAEDIGAPLVATNDAHYIKRSDAKAHDVLLAIQTGSTVDDENRMRFANDEFYLKSESEMMELFPEHPEAIENSHKIAERCNVEFEFGEYHLPEFIPPEGMTNKDYLRKLCYDGLERRYGSEALQDESIYRTRLESELEVIEKMGYVEYFLIVWDFIHYAKSNDIPVGPGRGSAAGSIVAYSLAITEIEPIKYNLIFERFLNPERVSMPDIDVDFCIDRRQEVIDYVVQKYGKDKVSQIITFGTLKAKAAVRDVGRALNASYAEADSIAKAIPAELGMTISKALDINRDLRARYETEPLVKNILDMSMAVEGMPRHSSTHAAGIVISKMPLDEYVPLYMSDKGLATQFNMTTIEELGLLKMDFLGLKNLTTIDEIVQMIHKHNPDFHILSIPLNDARTYRLFAQADTIGVFQFESDGMRNLLRKMKPNCFEDIIAALALFRPGPKDQINVYLEGRKNPSSVVYPSKELEPILKETYGVTIYQEQVMLMAQIAAKFSLVKADILRKAISKKNEDELAGLRQEYVRGCKENGYSDQMASDLFDLAEKFAGYGFNKSHAVAYGLVAYQLAYLKANYPLEFYTSILNSVIGDSTKSAIYITECRRKHISIEAPDVNRSTDIYYHNGKSIILPLSIIKDVGTLAARTILDERNKSGNFGDYFDFVARVVLRKINRTQLERLISAGALDNFDLGRTTMLNTLDDAIKYAKLIQVPFGTQLSIDPQLVSKPVVIRMKDSQEELSENEKAALGFNLGEQPIVHLRQKLGITYPPLAELNSNRGLYRGFAYIQSARQIRTRKGDLMCFLKLTDETGESDMAVMPNLYAQYSQYLVKGVYIQFYAKIQDEASFLANQIEIVRQK